MRFITPLFSSLLVAACSGTSDVPMSSGDALQSVNESSSNTEASMLADASIDLSTKFTFGATVTEALASIGAFASSQMPCASVTIADDTLALHFGAYEGSCVYHGLHFSGVQTITLSSVSATSVEIDHTWSKLASDDVQIGGSAKVIMHAGSNDRQVTSTIAWIRFSDGMTGEGSFDVTETPLDMSLGIESTGARSWSDASGNWSLAISRADTRWADALPQAGSYAVVAANGKEAAMTFARASESTILATVKSGAASYTFDVTAGGHAALQ